jgi:predicted nucleic acid-binding protein
MLKELPVTLIWEVDEPTMLTAGRFKATYRLSLADALIAAFAARQAAILVHKDPEYEALAGIVQQENLLHKTDVHGEGLQEACGKKPGTK